MTIRFGTIIRETRRIKGVTLEKLAKKIGTHKGYISGIESGHVSPPAPHFVKSLCKELGLPYQRMLMMSWWEKRPEDLELESAVEYLLSEAENRATQ